MRTQLYARSITNKPRNKKRQQKQTVVIYKKETDTEESYNNILGKDKDSENFIDLFESYIPIETLPVIVKIHDESNGYVINDLEAYNKLHGFENSLQPICDFICMDDKSRWENMTDSPIGLCNNKQDKLHFIVLKYIEDGDMGTFFTKFPQKHIIYSFIIQSIIALVVINYTYKIQHKDIVKGNILVGKTDKSRMHYRIFGKEYSIQTYGITPKFLDYGRSFTFADYIDNHMLSFCIIECISCITSYIKDENIKIKMQKFVHDNCFNHDIVFNDVLTQIRAIFVG